MSRPQHKIAGKKFNRLQVLHITKPNRHGQRMWLCECDCGNFKAVRATNIVSGSTKSCGCVRKENGLKHGGHGTGVYQSWYSMMDRCYKSKYKCHALYAAKGITVCDRWHDFVNFREDMGERPEGLTLDRRDNSKGYFPENCRWITNKEQQRNKDNNRYLTYEGKTLTIGEWGEIVGISGSIIHSRIRIGWTTEEALTIPVSSSNRISDIRANQGKT
jgi:hypothetical protein